MQKTYTKTHNCKEKLNQKHICDSVCYVSTASPATLHVYEPDCLAMAEYFPLSHNQSATINRISRPARGEDRIKKKKKKKGEGGHISPAWFVT